MLGGIPLLRDENGPDLGIERGQPVSVHTSSSSYMIKIRRKSSFRYTERVIPL